MISHEYKIIFVHIARTGGSSIEKWIQGQDQFLINKKEKHLTALEAKDLYSNYWSSYWKFSIVRDPIDRFCSMVKYNRHFGLSINNRAEVTISDYLKRYGQEIPLEHDHRYTKRMELLRLASKFQYNYEEGSLYGNILCDEMNRIFSYEKLNEAVIYLSNKFSLDPSKFPHIEQSHKTNSKIIIPKETEQIINSLHFNDKNKLHIPI